VTDEPRRQWTDAARRWDDPGESAVSMRDMVLQHDVEIDALKAWRSELKGAMLLVKFALGSSIASGLLAATALADLLLRGHA
jgi:hypothetical protein